MSNENIFLISFLLFIGFIIALDLGFFGKKNTAISIKQAGIKSFLMVFLAIAFYFVLITFGHLIHGIDNFEKLQYFVQKYHHHTKIISEHLEISIKKYNHNLGIEFLTGYLIEYALSVDNIFVILLIFTSFNVAKKHYHRVLFWGILGAIVMRFIFIFAGSALVQRFDWILYVFGGFLVFTGIKMFLKRNKQDEIDTQHHPVVKFAHRYFKIHKHFSGNKFWVNINGIKKITPLFLVLIIVEFTDVIFAVDSIPAIFSVTKDPYIVFFSNIFAIIGLRSMFFLLANIVDKLRFLKVGLSVLLVFIGIKMFAHIYLEKIGFKTSHSLLIIIAILGISILFSVLFPDKKIQKN
jgi:tellurite resistance protein TerC